MHTDLRLELLERSLQLLRDEPVHFSVTKERGDAQTELVSPPRWILDVEVCDNKKALGKQEPRLITETEAE